MGVTGGINPWEARPMELIETLRNIAVQEAFAEGRSAEEISG